MGYALEKGVTRHIHVFGLREEAGVPGRPRPGTGATQVTGVPGGDVFRPSLGAPDVVALDSTTHQGRDSPNQITPDTKAHGRGTPFTLDRIRGGLRFYSIMS